ncbi:MAG: hypothetical protein LBL82_05235 [Oscillospiraceae bacterium]|jgi:RNAse (barnase) inhibitor barstar|nr:hypothetical protein [Oscillospiraceae bacterium]
MKEYIVFARYMTGEEQAYRYVMRKLNLGRQRTQNAATLWEALVAVDEPTVIHIAGAASMKDKIGTSLSGEIIGVFMQAAAQNEMLTVELK